VFELFGPLHAHAFPSGAVLIYCHNLIFLSTEGWNCTDFWYCAY